MLDSNYAAEKIIGKSQADYVGRLASELEIEDMPEYLEVFAKVLQVEQHVEKEVRLLASGRYVHVVMYSTTPEEVICLLSDMTEMYETHERSTAVKSYCVIFMTIFPSVSNCTTGTACSSI